MGDPRATRCPRQRDARPAQMPPSHGLSIFLPGTAFRLTAMERFRAQGGRSQHSGDEGQFFMNRTLIAFSRRRIAGGISPFYHAYAHCDEQQASEPGRQSNAAHQSYLNDSTENSEIPLDHHRCDAARSDKQAAAVAMSRSPIDGNEPDA